MANKKSGILKQLVISFFLFGPVIMIISVQNIFKYSFSYAFALIGAVMLGSAGATIFKET